MTGHANWCGCGGLITDGTCEHCDDAQAYAREIEDFETGEPLPRLSVTSLLEMGAASADTSTTYASTADRAPPARRR